MSNSTTSEALRWRQVKAKIVVKFGTVAACASALGCSDEAIRQTVSGKCPRVGRKLKAVLG